MILLAWIPAYAAAALLFAGYYHRWHIDYERMVDPPATRGFTDFLLKPVADPALERRRRLGSLFGFALIAFGAAGLVVPLG